MGLFFVYTIYSPTKREQHFLTNKTSTLINFKFGNFLLNNQEIRESLKTICGHLKLSFIFPIRRCDVLFKRAETPFERSHREKGEKLMLIYIFLKRNLFIRD